MSKTQIVLAAFLVDFLLLTGWAVWRIGAQGLVDLLVDGGPGAILLAVDLVIALALIAVWMYRDARGVGLNATPYLVLTALTGSAGPLLYLIRRESAIRRADAAPQAA